MQTDCIVWAQCQRRSGAGLLSGLRLLISFCGLAGATAALWAEDLPFAAQEAPRAEASRLEGQSLRSAAARSALRAGLYGPAATLAGQWLDSAGDPWSAEAVRLRLVQLTALLASGEVEAAGAALEAFEGRPDIDAGAAQQLRLRAALHAFLRDDADAARAQLTAVAVEDLPADDRVWHHLLTALLAQQAGGWEAADAAFERARAATASERLEADIALLRLRVALRGRAPDPETLDALEATRERLRGSPGAREATLALAQARARQGRPQEARQLLEAQLAEAPGGTPDALRAAILLELGLLEGVESGRGRLALLELLGLPLAPLELQRAALQELSVASSAEARAAVLQGWTQLLASQPDHPLADRILMQTAYLDVAGGGAAAAGRAAEALLERFPGSDQTVHARQLLAYLDWTAEPPRYRSAARHLEMARERLFDAALRAALDLLIADAYFLRGDFALAAQLYAQAAPLDADTSGEVLFQRVLAHLRAGDLAAAEAALEGFEAHSDHAVAWQWRAEWNVLEAVRAERGRNAALERLRRLSDPARAALPDLLLLRFLWLEAQLLVEEGQATEALPLLRSLRETLERPEAIDVIPAEVERLMSYTLLLQGEALLAARRIAEAQEAFERLRTDHAESRPAQLSYFVSARDAAALGDLAGAQRSLVALVDRFATSTLAPVALWEAALMAEQRALASTFAEALRLLERLVRDYPEHELVFFARLRQAEITQRMGDFPAARLLYERLLNTDPDHPERGLAELGRADALLAEARPDARALAALIYERLGADAGVAPVVRAEAAHKWGLALQQAGRRDAAEAAWWQHVESGRAGLSAPERYWWARSGLHLARALERSGRDEAAAQVYAQIASASGAGRAWARQRLEVLADEPR